MATDHYRLRVQGLHQTEYNEVVMHFQGVNLTTADYLANAIDLLASFNTQVMTDWCAMFPTSYQVLRLSASKASPGGGGEVSQQFSYNAQPGTRSGGAASQQLCPVVRLIPPMGVKSAGKMFLPCVAESDANANVLSSTWLAFLAAYMAKVLGGIADGSITWTQAIYSRTTASFSVAQSYDTSPIIGFQRRRQRSPL